MIRLQKSMVAALVVAGLVVGGGLVAGQTKFVAPLRGQVDLEYTKPETKVDVKANLVRTRILVRNPSATNSIAGLKVDEYWYDKAGDPVTGDTFRYKKPLLPGETIVVELNTPKNPKMNRNSYNFSHANGTIKTKLVPKLVASAAATAAAKPKDE